MATRIPRHDFRTDNAAEAMAPVVAAVQQAVEGMETSEDDRYDALTLTLAAAKWRCLLDPKADELETWESWVLAMQVGSAHAAGTAQEDPVPLRVGTLDEVRRLPATGPQDYVHAGNWLTAFYLAVICRENDRLKQLAQVPVGFLRASGAEFDEYVYAWIETLQNFWFGRQETWNTLLTAVQGTAPEQARIADTDLMSKILNPPLELFQLYLRRDDQAFNDSLVQALTAKQKRQGDCHCRASAGWSRRPTFSLTRITAACHIGRPGGHCVHTTSRGELAHPRALDQMLGQVLGFDPDDHVHVVCQAWRWRGGPRRRGRRRSGTGPHWRSNTPCARPPQSRFRRAGPGLGAVECAHAADAATAA